MDHRPTHVFDLAVADAEVVTTYRRQITGLRRIVRTVSLRDHVEGMLPEVAAGLRRAGVRSSGPPVSLIRQQGTGLTEVTVGFPVGVPCPSPPFVTDQLPGGRVVQVLHPGPLDSILQTYDRLSEWLSAHGASSVPMIWEEYLVAAEATADRRQWWTRIVCPLAEAPPGLRVPSGRHLRDPAAIPVRCRR